MITGAFGSENSNGDADRETVRMCGRFMAIWAASRGMPEPSFPGPGLDGCHSVTRNLPESGF